MILGAAGDAGGLVLDAAGMGAVIGVPANVVSTAAVVTGGAMVVGGMGDLVMHATSDDQTSPARTDHPGSTAARDVHGVDRTGMREVIVQPLLRDLGFGDQAAAAVARRSPHLLDRIVEHRPALALPRQVGQRSAISIVGVEPATRAERVPPRSATARTPVSRTGTAPAIPAPTMRAERRSPR